MVDGTGLGEVIGMRGGAMWYRQWVFVVQVCDYFLWVTNIWGYRINQKQCTFGVKSNALLVSYVGC